MSVSGKKNWVPKAHKPLGSLWCCCQVREMMIPGPDCISLFSVAKINTRTTGLLGGWGGEGWFGLHNPGHTPSLREGRTRTQSRNCSKKHGGLSVHHDLLSILSETPQSNLPRCGTTPTWVFPHQLLAKKTTNHLAWSSPGQFDGCVFSIEVPSLHD
jgi:hypothetical protein